MRKAAVMLCAVLLLPVALVAADDDSLLNDEDVQIEQDLAFDIPGEQEKRVCSCRSNNTPENAICHDRPFYYLIKVQNWGKETADEVVLVDELDVHLDYLPGSTEMAMFLDEAGVGHQWVVIPDDPNNGFPLAGDGYKVADTLAPCDNKTNSCTDSRLIRFMVQPKNGVSKEQEISNIAIIKRASADNGYLTNANMPVISMLGNCPPITECPLPSRNDCGGEPPPCSEYPEECLDDDVIAGVDTDSTVTDEVADADETMSDVDTVKPKDDGCGCSLVF